MVIAHSLRSLCTLSCFSCPLTAGAAFLPFPMPPKHTCIPSSPDRAGPHSVYRGLALLGGGRKEGSEAKDREGRGRKKLRKGVSGSDNSPTHSSRVTGVDKVSKQK